MDRFSKPQSTPEQCPATDRNLPALTERHDLVTVPAAWPSGVSPLAQAVDACQRSDSGQVRTDWLARGPSNRAAAGFLLR